MIQLFYCCFAFVDTSPAVNNQQSDGMLMLWFSSDLRWLHVWRWLYECYYTCYTCKCNINFLWLDLQNGIGFLIKEQGRRYEKSTCLVPWIKKMNTTLNL